jgi:hypothetical protein
MWEYRIRRLAVGAALCIAFAAPIRADEIRVVTAGTVTANRPDAGDIFLSGPGFVFTARGFDGVGTASLDAPPGTRVGINSIWTGASSSLFQNGPVTVDGVSYSSIFVGNTISLDAGSFVVPSRPAGSTFTLQRPFTLEPESNLAGYARSPNAGNVPPLFHFAIAGTGIATVTLDYVAESSPGVGIPRPRSIVYQFASQLAPVPEPTTFVLFGVAVTLMAARRRFESRHDHGRFWRI